MPTLFLRVQQSGELLHPTHTRARAEYTVRLKLERRLKHSLFSQRERSNELPVDRKHSNRATDPNESIMQDEAT